MKETNKEIKDKVFKEAQAQCVAEINSEIEKQKNKPCATYAPMYCAMYPDLAEIAKSHGYALCVHGSLQRDFDLICIPWLKVVSKPELVIKDICEKFVIREIGEITIKEHNRVAHTLSIGFGECFIDLSFMPSIPLKDFKVTHDDYFIFEDKNND